MAKMATCLSICSPTIGVNKHTTSVHYNYFSLSKASTHHTLSYKSNHLRQPFPTISAALPPKRSSSPPSNSGPSGEAKDRTVLLHGTLHVTIYEAVLPTNNGESNRPVAGLMDRGPAGIYAAIDLGKAMNPPLMTTVTVAVTVSEHNKSCSWCQDLHTFCAHTASDVIFTLVDYASAGPIVVGRGSLPATELLEGKEIMKWIDIDLDEGKQKQKKKKKNGAKRGDAKLRVKLRFDEAARDHKWGRGVGSRRFPGVLDSFYGQRTGCRVSLYQDAHVQDGFIPEIALSGGRKYEARRCWKDVFDAISDARHLIYIAGWCLYPGISLERGSWSGLTLGELLKKKATKDGVRVAILVSDDEVGMQKNAGCENDLSDYFKGKGVHCVVSQHSLGTGGGGGGGAAKLPSMPDGSSLSLPSMFPHNQKFLVVDCAVPGEESPRKRRIVSFVGSIDLCTGRYDTPSHSFSGASSGEGSEVELDGSGKYPWHGVHSRLEGEVAWDVLSNFEQRWRKEIDMKTVNAEDNVLVNLREIDNVIPPLCSATRCDDPDAWNVQLFRSIDGEAVHGFPTTPEDAARAHLVCGSKGVFDRGIQDAYISAIRRAKSFVYIENQHFLGSCFDWEGDDHVKVEEVGCGHLVPKELSLKIASKIKAGERFAAYVVIPMWPEGESKKVQGILDWQRRTMEMMYRDIVQALRSKGTEEDPRNYLAFFCLGNREGKVRWSKIDVHSNTMIVDDEYIIVGSANINQRSMDGGRNTELAMGAYQPQHLAKRKPARGQVFRFRMALWYEHLGMIKDIDAFHHPGSEECVHMVNRIAERNWDLYASDDVPERDLQGHLLSYPVKVEVCGDGDVEVLPKLECFPGTNVPILGGKAHFGESYYETT